MPVLNTCPLTPLTRVTTTTRNQGNLTIHLNGLVTETRRWKCSAIVVVCCVDFNFTPSFCACCVELAAPFKKDKPSATP